MRLLPVNNDPYSLFKHQALFPSRIQDSEGTNSCYTPGSAIGTFLMIKTGVFGKVILECVTNKLKNVQWLKHSKFISPSHEVPSGYR